MFRLPPTSIGLSQNDLDFHLQQIDIYYGLLKQGFKKQEIIRYFHEQTQTVSGESYQKSLSYSRPTAAPSTLELSLREPGVHKDLVNKEKLWGTSPVTVSMRNDSPSPDVALQSSSQAGDRIVSCLETNTSDRYSPEPHAVSMPKPKSQISKKSLHAPRQSSLLRFTRTMSCETLSANHHHSVALLPRANIKYRPRTLTYSFEQSDIDSSSSGSDPVGEVSQNLEHLVLSNELVPMRRLARAGSPASSFLSPQAQEFLPSYLPSQYNPIALNPTELYTVYDTEQQRPDYSSGDQGVQTPRLVTRETSYSTTGLSLKASVSSLPNLLSKQDEDTREPEFLSPGLPSMPSDPRRRDDSLHTSKYHAYLDGSFIVYNDELPPQHQPQTPLELRHEQLTARTAAYTAPPGMARPDFSRGSHSIHGGRQVSGEQSPTRRAMAMQERRQRELLRSAQVEALRIERQHRRARTPDEEIAVGREQRTGEDELSLWRDELDADRVGVENFDDAELAVAFANGMRVVSGNRGLL